MKLLSVLLARSIWVAHMDDFNPRGKIIYPRALPFLLNEYKFKKYPDPNEMLDESKGLVFDGGEFVVNNGDPISLRLTVFNFGIVAETKSSTSDCDIFLQTLLSQLHESCNIADYENVVRAKHYLSQLYVTTDKSLIFINPKLKEISTYLSGNVTGHGKVEYELSGLSFWSDVKPVQPPPFTFERHAGVPFSEARYFSSAGLQTEKHLELLVKMEEILSS